MTDFHAIYRDFAREYEAMVAVEDEAGHVPAVIRDICPPDAKRVLDIGAGTGRLTMLAAPAAQHVLAVDRSAAMLAVTAERAARAGYAHVAPIVGDHRALPLPNESVDLALAGWTFGHSTSWEVDWQAQIGQSLAEAVRVLKPGAPLIIFETLGTGRETPAPPTDALAAFYAWMQADLGYQHRWIRTDYRFDSPAQGAQLTRFFFGDDTADRILAQRLTVLPECTGVWWTFKPD
jgi:ubiquinone/menaquinone biosynthesis C-methylase UbiE